MSNFPHPKLYPTYTSSKRLALLAFKSSRLPCYVFCICLLADQLLGRKKGEMCIFWQWQVAMWRPCPRIKLLNCKFSLEEMFGQTGLKVGVNNHYLMSQTDICFPIILITTTSLRQGRITMCAAIDPVISLNQCKQFEDTFENTQWRKVKQMVMLFNPSMLYMRQLMYAALHPVIPKVHLFCASHKIRFRIWPKIRQSVKE